MKKYLIILVLSVLCTGCGTVLDILPDREFENFSYTRQGFGGSAHITAEGAAFNNEGLVIKHFELKEVTPVCTIEISADNYVRVIKPTE